MLSDSDVRAMVKERFYQLVKNRVTSHTFPKTPKSAILSTNRKFYVGMSSKQSSIGFVFFVAMQGLDPETKQDSWVQQRMILTQDNIVAMYNADSRQVFNREKIEGDFVEQLGRMNEELRNTVDTNLAAEMRASAEEGSSTSSRVSAEEGSSTSARVDEGSSGLPVYEDTDDEQLAKSFFDGILGRLPGVHSSEKFEIMGTENNRTLSTRNTPRERAIDIKKLMSEHIPENMMSVSDHTSLRDNPIADVRIHFFLEKYNTLMREKLEREARIDMQTAEEGSSTSTSSTKDLEATMPSQTQILLEKVAWVDELTWDETHDEEKVKAHFQTILKNQGGEYARERFTIEGEAGERYLTTKRLSEERAKAIKERMSTAINDDIVHLYYHTDGRVSVRIDNVVERYNKLMWEGVQEHKAAIKKAAEQGEIFSPFFTDSYNESHMAARREVHNVSQAPAERSRGYYTRESHLRGHRIPVAGRTSADRSGSPYVRGHDVPSISRAPAERSRGPYYTRESHLRGARVPRTGRASASPSAAPGRSPYALYAPVRREENPHRPNETYTHLRPRVDRAYSHFLELINSAAPRLGVTNRTLSDCRIIGGKRAFRLESVPEAYVNQIKAALRENFPGMDYLIQIGSPFPSPRGGRHVSIQINDIHTLMANRSTIQSNLNRALCLFPEYRGAVSDEDLQAEYRMNFSGRSCNAENFLIRNSSIHIDGNGINFVVLSRMYSGELGQFKFRIGEPDTLYVRGKDDRGALTYHFLGTVKDGTNLRKHIKAQLINHFEPEVTAARTPGHGG